MEWVETTGKSIEEAKDAALDELGIDESDAEFEVLEEPRTGLFGRVRGEARIRARIQPTVPRPKVERRDRKRREGPKGTRKTGGSASGDTKTATEPASTAASTAASKPAKKAASSTKSSTKSSTRSSTTTKAPSTGRSRAKADAETDAGADVGSSDRVDESADGATSTRSRSKPATATRAPKAPATSGAPVGGTDMTDEDVTVEEQAALTATFLGGLVDAFGLTGTIEQVHVDDDTMEVLVVGDDLGLLIGPKGHTLMAVQELSRTYVQRKATGTHHGRIRIDVGGYRQKRREALDRFTRQVAEQVLESGIQKALEPMNASDRKVVHDTANTIEGVKTMSEGEEPRRRVVIAPE